ncbi:hypothetical protein BJ165DRAFT_1468439 [Panaeolus papilionaceus]|nr:hypothetical protein BJ165DRAFT_1468439 [Panaeolus papilionaceus]
MSSIFGFVSRVYKVFNPPISPLTSTPLRFGVLSAADITVNALIIPVKSHPDVVIAAIAGRDEAKVSKFAKKHGIGKVYSGSGSYDELVNDPDIDAVYIPLPHMFHYEWSLKALNAGKHVLVEKPMVNTPEEAARLHDVAREKGLVIMEAMHTRFHPAIQRVKEIIDSGELGAVTHVEAAGLCPKGAITRTYTENDFKEGRGVLMDVGCYPIEVIRYFTSPTSMTVSSATHTSFPNLPQLDFTVEANLDIVTSSPASRPNPTATFRTSIAAPHIYGVIPNLDMSVTIRCTNGSVYLSNYMIPAIYHKIVVKHTEGNEKGAKVKHERVEKVYVFGPRDGDGMKKQGADWWTTYRYQLEAFVDRVREREPRTWYEKSDSVQNLEWVGEVYRKLGLEQRPPSGYFVSESRAK